MTPETESKLIEAMKRALATFAKDPAAAASASAGPLTKNNNYSRVINERHYARLSKLLDSTKGEVAFGGKRDDQERKIEVTVVRNLKPDDALMSGAWRGGDSEFEMRSEC